MFKQISKSLRFVTILIITIILTLGFSISLQSLLASWTAPSGTPPANNMLDLNISGSLGVDDDVAMGNNAMVVNNLTVGNNISTGGSIGIGIAPAQKLDVNGNMRLRGQLNCSGKLYTNASGDVLCGVDQTGSVGITGSGNSGYLPRWNGSTSLTNSLIQDNGSTVGIGKAPDASYRLDLSGAFRASGLGNFGSTLYATGLNIGAGVINAGTGNFSGISASGNIYTNGYSTFPSGFGGGIRAWDVAAGGSVLAQQYCNANGTTCKTITDMGGSGLGIGQTWQNVNASRALGATYTNSTGKPISVIIWGNGSGDGLYVYINGIEIRFMSGAGSTNMSGSFIVPVGAAYRVYTKAGFTKYGWAELR